MSERWVVLGSNSFSGAHFVQRVLEEGAEVIGISRSPEPHRAFLPYRTGGRDQAFRFHRLDLNDDLDAIMQVVRDFAPDYVVNFAAQSMVAESWLTPAHWFQTNVVANVLLHDQLRQCRFLKKYVHVSTPEVYGPCAGLIAEHTNYNPSTPYAVSRAAADMSLMTFWKAYQFPVVFTRAANVYGPGQQLYRIIPRTILSFLSGKTLPLQGGGRSVRSFIHIRDVADGTLRAARAAPPGAIYHLSTARNISIREVVELLAQRMGVRFEDQVEIVGDRLGKDSAYLLDSARARRELGWEPAIALEQGLDDTRQWVQDYLGDLQAMPWNYVHKP
ncbi:MAG: GDP-mannose 4,6-dehydratase [Lentisphaerae bacterium]|nr:GDP-mannose 4,6-dehydratase [Lentisphaerota bacterium]